MVAEARSCIFHEVILAQVTLKEREESKNQGILPLEFKSLSRNS